MERLITLHPHASNYKEVFQKFNHVLFRLSSDELVNKWYEYKERYNFDPTHFGGGGSFEHQNWNDMYNAVPESIELWTVQGTDFGLDIPVSYDEFSRILKGRKFISPPFGTGLWIPEACSQQNIYFESKLNVFSPIKPTSGKEYKTVHIVLDRNPRFLEGKIHGTLEDLRPTETFISPKIRWIVQKVSN